MERHLSYGMDESRSRSATAPCVDNKDTQGSDAVFSNLGGSQYQTPFKQRLPREEWFTCHTHAYMDVLPASRRSRAIPY